MEKSINSWNHSYYNKNQSNSIQDLNELYYQGKSVALGVPISFIQENLSAFLNKKNIDKYLDRKDIEKLANYLPESSKIVSENQIRENIANICNHETSKNNEFTKFYTPIELFTKMLSKRYFTKAYQKNLERFKIETIEEYIKTMQSKYSYFNTNYVKYFTLMLNKNMNEELSEDENIPVDLREYLRAETNLNNNVKFETYSYLASSGYTSLNSDDEKEDLSSENLDQQVCEVDTEKQKEETFDGQLSDERFKNLKMNKNQLTIRPRTKDENKEFQLQEMDRYRNPHLPWTYINSDGSSSVVAPVLKKIPTGTSSKPRDHVMLKPDRPSYVTILCLARDAASRLPDGVGTRADICDLLKDSQYINERLSDSQINNIVSGALDRLHYEKDPCVKYDLQKKLWIYLHKNRSTDYLPWNEHLKKNELKSDKNTNDVELGKDDLDRNEKETSNNINNVVGTNTSSKKGKKGGEKMLKNKRKHS